MGYGPDLWNAAWYDRCRSFIRTAGKQRPGNAYRVEEVADVTGLSKFTVYKYVKSGVFKEVELSRTHREIWITKASVLVWLERSPKRLARAVRYRAG